MAAGNEVLESLERRVAHANTREKLAQLASEAGHAIAAHAVTSSGAETLSRSMSRARLERGAFEDGYLKALADVLAAVAAATADDTERRAIVARVERSDALRTIVRSLDSTPASPAALARVLGAGANDGRVTRHLATLEKLGVVEPAPAADRRERPRQLTPRGHRIARELDNGIGAGAERASITTTAWSEEERLTNAIVGMFHLTVRCRNVTVPELAACVGGRDAASERLAWAFASASEQRGLVDMTFGGRCVWERGDSRKSWSLVLARYDGRWADLRSAFDGVPSGFDLWTDAVEDWRDAFAKAGVSEVRDVCSHFMGQQVMDETSSAVVVDDDTVAASLARRLGPDRVFLAKPHHESVLVTRV